MGNGASVGFRRFHNQISNAIREQNYSLFSEAMSSINEHDYPNQSENRNKPVVVDEIDDNGRKIPKPANWYDVEFIDPKTEYSYKAICDEDEDEVSLKYYEYRLGRFLDTRPLPTSVLHHAVLCKSGDDGLQICKDLLEHGCDPNMPNQSGGLTALHLAFMAADQDLIDLLIDHGASLESKTDYPIIFAFGEYKILFEPGSTPWDVAMAMKKGMSDHDYDFEDRGVNEGGGVNKALIELSKIAFKYKPSSTISSPNAAQQVNEELNQSDIALQFIR